VELIDGAQVTAVLEIFGCFPRSVVERKCRSDLATGRHVFIKGRLSEEFFYRGTLVMKVLST
jgi:hypothetical protein